MAKYRTRIVEIHAIEFQKENIAQISRMAKDAGYYIEQGYSDGEDFLYIYTDDGRMKADIGDYVIKGLRGEIYSSKPDVFHAKYKKLDADE